MAKKSRKRLARYEKDQSGCMWSLISIFDFRQGRSSQKLLPDRKRGSRRILGAAYPNSKLESLTDSCEICKDIDDTAQSETAIIDSSKLSVKELMEEEMVGEPDQTRHGSIANGDTKESALGDGGHAKKKSRRSRSKISFDLDADDFVAAEDLVAERPSRENHKSSSCVDLNVVVEELCSRIHQKDVGCLKHGQDDEPVILTIEDPSIIEEKLVEAAKVLMNHFTAGKSFTKDGLMQPSRELVDALQILNSNKEVLLKLLHDPNSQLVKDVQSLQEIQVEEGKFKVLMGSDLLEQDLGNSKQQSFFWRRFKGLERSSSKKSDTFEDLSRIVVLKPGPRGSRNVDTAMSLPESLQSVEDKGHTERVSSPFSFAEFKRKLKHAMRKEQNGVVHNGMSRQPIDELPNLENRDKKVGGETVAMASPSRDHFFIERIPKSSSGFKKVDKTGKLKDGKVHQEHDNALTTEKRVSNIYVEAKKHLADIVGNRDVDVDTLGRQVPKSLGRILSYSGYSSPTISSPRKEGDVRLSPKGECPGGDKKTGKAIQETDIAIPVQVEQESESEPCESDNKPVHEARVLSESGVDNAAHESETPTSEVEAEIVGSPHAETEKESCLMDISSEPGLRLPINMNEQVDSPLQCHEENRHSTSLGQDTCDENEPSSCPSPSALAVTKKTEDVDVMSDATSRPSPISVLEPLFKEEDISPPSIKSLADFAAGKPIQPRQIRFEEEISASLERGPCNRTSVEDDKYTYDFVKSVLQMSGLTWDELLRRSLFSDHLVDPSLIDEVDFLPDWLPCDFNLLFNLITEILVEICQSNFSCMLSLYKPFAKPELRRKDILSEVWKGINWYLKLEGPRRKLEEVGSKDFAKAVTWTDLRPDCESIGIQMQESILEELVEYTISGFLTGSLATEFNALPPAVTVEIETDA